MFGERYNGLLKSQLLIMPKIISYIPYGDEKAKGWINKFEGWNIFFMIDDSFGNK